MDCFTWCLAQRNIKPQNISQPEIYKRNLIKTATTFPLPKDISILSTEAQPN